MSTQARHKEIRAGKLVMINLILIV